MRSTRHSWQPEEIYSSPRFQPRSAHPGARKHCRTQYIKNLDRGMTSASSSRGTAAARPDRSTGYAAYRPSSNRRAWPIAVRASSKGVTLAARLPLNARATLPGGRGGGKAATALNCSGRVFGYATLILGQHDLAGANWRGFLPRAAARHNNRQNSTHFSPLRCLLNQRPLSRPWKRQLNDRIVGVLGHHGFCTRTA